MKKQILLILFIAVISFATKAQTAQGTMTIGGDVGVQNTSITGGSSTNTTTFSPSFGYFISDKLLLGAALGISNSTTAGTTTSSTSISPFVRFYKFTADEKFAFFAQGAVGYSTATGQKGVFSLSIRPGFAYFFTPHWGLDFSLSGLTYTNGNNETTFGLTASLTPNLGFRYYFGK